jgi:Spy/CpxP family protein refolding chaperone
MKSVAKNLLMLVLVLVIAAPLAAAEGDKKKKKKPGKRPAAGARIQIPKGIELSDEQKEKVAALKKEYGPKVVAARKKMALGKDARKARGEALKKAKADGKKGKELRAAVDAAAPLTDEQKAAQAEMQALQKEIRAAVVALLTDEQKAKLPKRGGKKKGGKKKKKDA